MKAGVKGQRTEARKEEKEGKEEEEKEEREGRRKEVWKYVRKEGRCFRVSKGRRTEEGGSTARCRRTERRKEGKKGGKEKERH